jgi:hypothetical protein
MLPLKNMSVFWKVKERLTSLLGPGNQCFAVYQICEHKYSTETATTSIKYQLLFHF